MDAYGEYDKSALKEFPKNVFPKDATFTVGERFVVQTPNGPYPIKIAEVKDKSVVVDFNHPLAGKDLTFDVLIVKIRDATKEELAQVQPPAAQPASTPAPTSTTGLRRPRRQNSSRQQPGGIEVALSVFLTSDLHLGMKFAGYPDAPQAALVEARFCLP